MLAALDVFKDKPNSNIRQTGRNHMVPESTLRCYINRHNKGINVSQPKGATNRRLLMDTQENVMFKYVADCSKIGLSVSNGNIMDFLRDMEATSIRHEHEGSEYSREELEARLDTCNLFYHRKYRQGWFRNFKKKLQDKGLKLKKPEPIAVRHTLEIKTLLI